MRAPAVHAVSPAARSVSLIVIPVASKTCQTALIASIDVPSRTSVMPSTLSGANQPSTTCGTTRYAAAIATIQVIVQISVSLTVGHTSSRAPAPIDWPATIAPADASPNAGMNATELIAITTLSAATVGPPSVPTTTLTNSWNAVNSSSQFTPFGKPKRSTRPSSRQLKRSAFARCGGASPQPRRKLTASTEKPSHDAIVLAIAAPSTP